MRLLLPLALIAGCAPAYAEPQSGGHPILEQTFQRETDHLSGFPLTAGNRFELLETGAQAFPRKLALIEGAKHTVLFTSMVVVQDSSTKRFQRALLDAHRRGVDVRCPARRAAGRPALLDPAPPGRGGRGAVQQGPGARPPRAPAHQDACRRRRGRGGRAA